MNTRPVIENNILKNSILDDDFDAVCATEQTGLIPFAPEDEYELDSYNEIINFSANRGFSR